MDPTNKKPTTDSTGYIICIYQVFKGDDGEKFERNWLYWTGAQDCSFLIKLFPVVSYGIPVSLNGTNRCRVQCTLCTRSSIFFSL
jgi:hypothetical protein